MRTLASRLLGILVAALVLAPATGVAAATAASDPPVSPDRMVVHGEITDSGGQGIHGAWVAVYQLDNGRPRLGGVTRTDTSGAYEMDVQLPAGTVVVRVALRYSGGVYTSARQLSIEPGHSYSVNARLFPERGFLFGSVPEAPVITTVVAKSGSATVDWTAPANDGGAEITQYTVRVYEATSGTLVRTMTVPATQTEVTVTGLANGTAYTFDVRAENAIGAGSSARSTETVAHDDPHALVAAVATGAGEADLASRGEPGNLLVRPWSASTGLGEITDLGGGLVGAPAITGRGERREVFVRGTDDALWWRSRAGADWSRWESLGGRLTGRPAAVALPDGGTLIAVPGTDRGLWVRERSPDGRWGRWSPLRGGVQIPGGAGAALAVTAPDRVELVVRGADDALWERSWVDSGSSARWTGWSSLGGGVLGDPALTADGAGRAVAVVRGTNRAGYVRTVVDGRAVSGWVSLGGVLTASPVAIEAVGSDRVDVLANNEDATLTRTTRTDGTWSSWVPAE